MLTYLIKTFFSAGLSFHKSDERYRKVYLITSTSLVLYITLIFYIAYNLTVTKLYLLTLIECLSLAVGIITYWILRSRQNIAMASTLLVLNVFILTSLFIYDQNHHDYAFAQAVFVPLLAIFLKGKRIGALYTLIYFALILLIAYSGINIWQPVPFTITSFTNLFTTYIIVFALVYYFELSRSEAIYAMRQARMQEHQTLLELKDKKDSLKATLKELQEYKESLESKVEETLKEKRAQEQILMQQSKMAAMGEMIAAIAHQWKQPLSTASVIIDSMQIQQMLEQSTALNEDLDSLTEQIDYMSQTITDFSNFFRPSKEMQHFKLLEAVDNVIKLMEHQLVRHRITLSKVDFDDSIEILGLKNEFLQVLLNIINNAKDALKSAMEEDRLQEEEAQITLSLRQNRDTIALTVADNGGGIDLATLPYVFDPYFTTKEEGIGTGIGLYMSKIIIEEHMYGKLTCSNNDKGAVFTITFEKESAGDHHPASSDTQLSAPDTESHS